LSFAKWVALASLARFGECSMTRLARLSAADRTTLTRSIDGLIRDGLVERGTQASDRRKVVVRLTAEGHEVLGRIREDIHPINQEVCAELTEEEQVNLATYLRKILGGIDYRAGMEARSAVRLGRPGGAGLEPGLGDQLRV
jgi:DNA-binding MarR family transcriptional regulator